MIRLNGLRRWGSSLAILALAVPNSPSIAAQAYMERLDPRFVGPEADLLNALFAALRTDDDAGFNAMIARGATLRGPSSDQSPVSLTLTSLRAFLARCTFNPRYFTVLRGGLQIVVSCHVAGHGDGERVPLAMNFEVGDGRVGAVYVGVAIPAPPPLPQSPNP